MGLWWDPFVQSRKCMGLKFTGEFCVIIMKNYEELRVMFDGTEYWYNIWRKTDLCFQKWHEEFSKFSSEHLKMLKLVFSWDPFAQSGKYMSLKFTEEL